MWVWQIFKAINIKKIQFFLLPLKWINFFTFFKVFFFSDRSKETSFTIHLVLVFNTQFESMFWFHLCYSYAHCTTHTFILCENFHSQTHFNDSWKCRTQMREILVKNRISSRERVATIFPTCCCYFHTAISYFKRSHKRFFFVFSFTKFIWNCTEMQCDSNVWSFFLFIFLVFFL